MDINFITILSHIGRGKYIKVPLLRNVNIVVCYIISFHRPYHEAFSAGSVTGSYFNLKKVFYINVFNYKYNVYFNAMQYVS